MGLTSCFRPSADKDDEQPVRMVMTRRESAIAEEATTFLFFLFRVWEGIVRTDPGHRGG